MFFVFVLVFEKLRFGFVDGDVLVVFCVILFLVEVDVFFFFFYVDACLYYGFFRVHNRKSMYKLKEVGFSTI